MSNTARKGLFTDTTGQQETREALGAVLEQARKSAERELETISDNKCRLVFIREYYLPIISGVAETLGAVNGYRV